MHETANRIKELRSRKGYSQEELAERSGLSLRTIQRIENGETEPRGDSLTRLAAAFDVTVDDLADWGVAEDSKYIAGMNLSALSFLFFPLLGILVPLIIWLTKKDKVKGVNEAARRLLNFQITWTIILFIGCIFLTLFVASLFDSIQATGDVSPTLVAGAIKGSLRGIFLFVGSMYAVNVIMILVNSARSSSGKKVVYRPAIPFIRK